MKPNWKLWLEKDGTHVFGRGAYELLRSIQKTQSIAKSAESLGMSYRYAWGMIREVQQKMGVRILETRKGGREGGGATVTEDGLRLMNLYDDARKAFERTAADLRDPS